MEYLKSSMNNVEAAVFITDEILDVLRKVAATVQAEIPLTYTNDIQVTLLQFGAMLASDAMIATIKKMQENAFKNVNSKLLQA
jgi:hypothetical protein